jgi:hypothetical protein
MRVETAQEVALQIKNMPNIVKGSHRDPEKRAESVVGCRIATLHVWHSSGADQDPGHRMIVSHTVL